MKKKRDNDFERQVKVEEERRMAIKKRWLPVALEPGGEPGIHDREDVAVGSCDGVGASVGDGFAEFLHEGAEVFVVEVGKEGVKGVLAGADGGHEVKTIVPGCGHIP